MTIHDQLLTRKLLVDQSMDLAVWYGGSVLIFCVLLWIYMLVYVHRLTGPIYKLQQLLEKCTHNRSLPEYDLKFRKGDGFHELADKFNDFVQMLKKDKA
jgi:sensor histidine kinase YesM